MTGSFKSPMGEIQASGRRLGGELIGKWELTSSSDRGPRTSLLTVFGDLSGRYESFGGEIPIKEIRLEAGQVSFSIEMGFGDQTFKLDFKAKLEGKTLKGEVTSQRGTREVTGKKLDEVSPIVGTWEITRQAPPDAAQGQGQNQGPRTSTLVIKADMTGTYAGRNSTAPLTDLKLEGDQVSFKVVVKYGDREVPMEFKGKLEGGALKGAFTSSRGTREATGKKVGQ
jgi:hypothetical protein